MAKSVSKLALRIRKSRLEAQLSQSELGDTLGLTDKSISAYEAGRATPPLPVLEKLSKTVEKPLSYFVEGGNEVEHTIAAKLTAVERELAEIKKLLRQK